MIFVTIIIIIIIIILIILPGQTYILRQQYSTKVILS